MTAVAVLPDPTATSGAVVRVPAVPLVQFPFTFPTTFKARPAMNGHATLLPAEFVTLVEAAIAEATSELHAPTVIMGEDITVDPPAMESEAEMHAPTPEGGVIVEAPVMKARIPVNGFPYELPIVFGQEGVWPPEITATTGVSPDALEASAELLAPTLTSSVVASVPPFQVSVEIPTPAPGVSTVVEAAHMEAEAEAAAPTVAAGAGISPPAMTATGMDLWEPTIASGNVVTPLILGATGTIPTPDVSSGASLTAPIMEADAELLEPYVEASDAPAVEAPEMEATAELHEPSITFGATVQAPAMGADAGLLVPGVEKSLVVVPPVMEADAETAGFPYTFPFHLGVTAGIIPPRIYMWTDTAYADPASADADLLVPTIGSGGTVSVPVMGASAEMQVPAIASGSRPVPPVMGASASMPLPQHGPPAMSPVTQQFTTAGAYTYSIPAHAIYIDIILLGGGEGGENGRAAFQSGSGGQAGKFTTLKLQRGVDIPWSLMQISGTVGTAGGSNGGAGGGTTAIISGLGTYTGAGGNGQVSGQNGQSAGSVTYNGVTYTGGNGGTGNGGAGSAPGGGGAGGNGGLFSGSSGGAGAVGRAWFRAYQ
ncbi:minor tail protein [Mycobacterium phage WIVsmall]|uniref:minor tail protein n=1 Tax=Mycobacterium phage WIVsmall TaxID=1327036 RepID=UPI00032B53B9|nr:minor tail protein [Mycobacterium phage WIVsmall]AGK88219.1 putative structural protein [Mycobacterium phage WIVsmall]